MKKITSAIFISLILITGLFAKENFVSFNLGLSTGIPFYGSDRIDTINKSLDKPGRVIIGTYGNINFNVINQATFFLGTDLLCDFIWKDGEHSNHLHLGFPVGFKIYPDLGGFAFGLAYMLGFRADYIDLVEYPSYNKIAAWGNGFKLLVEYNLAKTGKSRFLPTFGFSWSFMPRGSYSYDNLLTFYGGVNF